MNLKRKMRKGFTLVELVVVIAVIAVLAAVSVGAYFGVTDSANSSAADQTNKQVRDLWVMYSVGEYDDKLSLYDNATDFCLRYFEENGQGDVDINFKTGDESKGELLLKIETTYPTYIYIEDKRIVEYSEICKSEEAFVEVISSSELVADTFKNDQPFEIESFEFEGETVRGFSYYQVNITNLPNTQGVETLIVKNGLSVVDGDDAELTSYLIPGTIGALNSSSNYTSYGSPHNIYSYEDGIKGEEFDTTIPRTLENNSNFNISKYEADKYGYVINDLDILYEANFSTDVVNLVNYPVCVATATYSRASSTSCSTFKAEFFKSLNEYCEYKNIEMDENGFYNISHTSFSDKNHGFIFLGNTYINKNVNFINYNVILEYETTYDSFKKYVNYRYDKSDSMYSTIQHKYNTSSERMINATASHLENKWEFNTTSKVTITENTVVNLVSTNLSVEAILGVPLGVNSETPGFETKKASQLINNGIINVDGNSIFRSLGLTTGTGEINTTRSSTIYEPFKLISEQGRGEGILEQNYKDKYFIFPIYEMDSIKCKCNIVEGAKYTFIIPLVVTPLSTNYFLTDKSIFIGANSDNSLFRIEKGSITKTWDANKNRIVLTLDENSIVNDSQYTISVKKDVFLLGELGFEVSNSEFNYSISNMEIVVSNNATFNLSSSAIYEVNPLAKIHNKEGGIINLNSGKFGILNFTDEQLNSLLSSSINNIAQTKIFNLYKTYGTNDIFVNEGQINVGKDAILCFANREGVEFGNIIDSDHTNFSTYTYKYLTDATSYGALELNYWRDQTTN